MQNQPAIRSPSASDIAPVSVAKSTMCVAPFVRAWCSASARISRPSASVLITSIVFPFAARSTSPGRYDVADCMFSAAAITAIVRTGRRSSATAAIPSSTAAPPAMSPFMSCIRSGGFNETPPESKVIALPTSPSTTSATASGGS